MYSKAFRKYYIQCSFHIALIYDRILNIYRVYSEGRIGSLNHRRQEIFLLIIAKNTTDTKNYTNDTKNTIDNETQETFPV